MKNQLSLLLTFFLSGCLSINLLYKGDFELPDGTTGTVTFADAYPTKETAIGCGLTFWLYGGWCWTYVLMPYESHREALRNDVRATLTKTFKQPATITGGNVIFRGWQPNDLTKHIEINEPVKKVSQNADKPVNQEIENSRTIIFTRENHHNYFDRKRTYRLTFPFILGLGLAVEEPFFSKLDIELGIGGTALHSPGQTNESYNNSFAYLNTKYILDSSNTFVLKAGFAAVKVADKYYGGPGMDAIKGGIVLDLKIDNGYGLQFIHIPETDDRPLNLGLITYQL